MIYGLPDVKLLEKRDGLLGEFRFGNLDGLFAVKLVVKNPVNLDDFKDPLDKGGDTRDASPSLHPGGF